MGKKPYHRPTRADQEERCAFTAFLLSRYARKGEIKSLLKARFGVSARTCERLLARARELLLEGTGASPEEHRLRAFSFYVSVIRDPASTLRERMLAQKRIDKLLGLELRGPAAEVGREAGPDPFAAIRQQALADPEARDLLARLAERLGGLEAGEMQAQAEPGHMANSPCATNVPCPVPEARPPGRPARRLAG
jgi:hypothetical protein